MSERFEHVLDLVHSIPLRGEDYVGMGGGRVYFENVTTIVFVIISTRECCACVCVFSLIVADIAFANSKLNKHTHETHDTAHTHTRKTLIARAGFFTAPVRDVSCSHPDPTTAVRRSQLSAKKLPNHHFQPLGIHFTASTHATSAKKTASGLDSRLQHAVDIRQAQFENMPRLWLDCVSR